MSVDPLTLAAGFDEPTEADWLAAIDKALRGKSFDRLVTTTEDGIELQPLYTLADAVESGSPGASPRLRGRTAAGAVSGGWDVRAEHRHPDLAVTNDAMLVDLERGVTSLQVRLDAEARLGTSAWTGDQVAHDGIPVRTVDHLERLLEGVLLDLAPVALDAGHAGLAAAAALLKVIERRGVPAADALAALRVDPLGSLALAGSAPGPTEDSLAAALELAAHVDGVHPKMTALAVDTSPYSAAGATDAHELALALATGAEWLRAADVRGLAPELVARRIEVTLTVDADVFASIAKLRAARALWDRLLGACGVAEAERGVAIHARTADAMFTRVDPWTNMLRVTAACFAAGTGGADGVTVLPFDHAVGVSESFGRRIARNTQVILQEESHLGRVVDPAGGSWYVEQRTRALAEASWERFRAIERDGGLLAGLRSGAIATAVQADAAARAEQVADRRRPLTGVTEFPLLDEDPVPVAEPDRAGICAGLAAVADMAVALDPSLRADFPNRLLALDQFVVGPVVAGTKDEADALEPAPVAGPVEALRDAAERHRLTTGTRPRVFLANLGPLAVHTARTTFVTNALAVGGVEAIGPQGVDDTDAVLAAFSADPVPVAVVCTSDDLAAEQAGAVAAGLRERGATRVLVAGAHDGPGLDGNVRLGMDVVSFLQQLHTDLEVAS